MTGPQLTDLMHEAYRVVMPTTTPFDDNRGLGKAPDPRRMLYRQLQTQGYTFEQFKLVLEYLQYKVRKAGWDEACLSLRRVCDPYNFADKLGQAHIWSKGVARTRVNPKSRVLGQFRGHTEHSGEPIIKTPGPILREMVQDLVGKMRKAVDGQEEEEK